MEASEVKSPINLNEVSGYNAAQKNKPKAEPNKLDNTAFMRLFLEQLKNQDPTSPMETDKIITQTAQLTQVEMQEQTKQTMIEVANAMKSTQETNKELKDLQSDMKIALENLIAVLANKDSANLAQSAGAPSGLEMIGKIAETKINGLNLVENQKMDFELYFDEAINASLGTPKILVQNESGETIREIDISDKNGMSGYLHFSIEGKDDKGQNLPSGAYNIIAQYNFKGDGTYNLARVGRGEVQSVILNDGKVHLRMGELIVPLEDALEFYLKQGA
ncbi:flagellar hook assembly protein FlgD [Helicobacter sp. 23-1044]